MRIIITGTPGTGKTSLSRELGLALNCRVIHVNDMIKQDKVYSRIEGKEYIANLPKLKKILDEKFKLDKNLILESHILSDIKLRSELVIVFRCQPKELEKRLKKRKYAKAKIKENVMSEILDYCYINSLENYGEGKVMQLETTKKTCAKEVIAQIAQFEKTSKTRNFRWLAEMAPKTLLHYS